MRIAWKTSLANQAISNQGATAVPLCFLRHVRMSPLKLTIEAKLKVARMAEAGCLRRL